MNAISFAWTTPALKARRKKVTRRSWKHTYAARFHGGHEYWALDKGYRNGGKRIGVVRLLKDPYLQRTSKMPDSAYEDEGFAYFEEHPDELPASAPWKTMSRKVLDDWREKNERLYVVEYEIVEIFDEP